MKAPRISKGVWTRAHNFLTSVARTSSCKVVVGDYLTVLRALFIALRNLSDSFDSFDSIDSIDNLDENIESPS